MIFKKISDTNTLEENIQVLKGNITLAKKIRKEIKTLKEQEENTTIKEITSQKVVSKPEVVLRTEEVDASFEKEVEGYYQDILEISNSENLEQDIAECMPLYAAYRYDDIIRTVKIKLLKEIKDNSLFLEMKDDFTKEELEELKDSNTLIKEKIRIINEKAQEEQQIKQEQVENILLFPITRSGNVIAFNNIDDMEPETYEGLLKVLQSIIDGTMSNVERYRSTNLSSAGMCKIRVNKERVIFTRVGKHAYAIVAMYTKKGDNDKGYRDKLAHHTDYYRDQKRTIKDGLNNDEYLKEQMLVQEELLIRLGGENEIGSQKVKRGDYNE